MAKLIADWRYKEIQCIADTIICRASYCLVGRLAAIAEHKFLKTFSHISFLIDPTLDLGVAEVDPYESNYEKCLDNNNLINYYSFTIRFNGDAATKEHWEITTKGLLRAIAEIIFFSPARNLPDGVEKELESIDKEKYIEKFVTKTIKKQPFDHHAVRPRFTLASLKDIIETDTKMSEHKDQLLPYLQRILGPYFGPDAIMQYSP